MGRVGALAVVGLLSAIVLISGCVQADPPQAGNGSDSLENKTNQTPSWGTFLGFRDRVESSANFSDYNRAVRDMGSAGFKERVNGLENYSLIYKKAFLRYILNNTVGRSLDFKMKELPGDGNATLVLELNGTALGNVSMVMEGDDWKVEGELWNSTPLYELEEDERWNLTVREMYNSAEASCARNQRAFARCVTKEMSLFAINESDLLICDSIFNYYPETRPQNYPQIWAGGISQPPGIDYTSTTSCYANMIKSHPDEFESGICDNLRVDYKSCLIFYAVVNNESSLCRKMATIYEDFCYSQIAILNNYSMLCNNISDVTNAANQTRKLCAENIYDLFEPENVEELKEDHCDMFMDLGARKEGIKCYTEVALTYNDEEICMKIPASDPERENCLATLEYYDESA